MRNPRSSIVRIENPLHGHSPFTSKRAADGFVERGAAVWISRTMIRFRDSSEVVAERRLLREIHNDHQYWADIARQRGGENVSFVWRGSKSNGYQVMGATVVVSR